MVDGREWFEVGAGSAATLSAAAFSRAVATTVSAFVVTFLLRSKWIRVVPFVSFGVMTLVPAGGRPLPGVVGDFEERGLSVALVCPVCRPELLIVGNLRERNVGRAYRV